LVESDRSNPSIEIEERGAPWRLADSSFDSSLNRGAPPQLRSRSPSRGQPPGSGEAGLSWSASQLEEVFVARTRLFRKLFFYDDGLVGATMIGPPKVRKKLIEIMRGRETITRVREELLDPADLKD
jgi:hypothetical protein